MKEKHDLRDPTRLAAVAQCLDLIADAILALTERKHETGGLIAHYTAILQWHRDGGDAAKIRARARDIQSMRRVLDGAIAGKQAGAERIDATLRSAVCWSLWRTVSLALARHDGSAVIWCRMTLAQIRARYEGEAPPELATEPEGTES